MAVSRLFFLRPDERKIFKSSLSGDWETKLAEFERTGIVPKDVTHNDIRAKLESLPKKYNDFAKKVLDATKNEASLTDEELSARAEAYGGQGASGKEQADYQEAVKGKIFAYLSGITGSINAPIFPVEAKRQIAETIASMAATRSPEDIKAQVNNMLAPFRVFRDEQSGRPVAVALSTVTQKILSAIPEPPAKAATNEETQANIARVNDLLATRVKAREEEQGVQNLINPPAGGGGGLQEELARGRESFLTQATTEATRQYGETIAPSIAQNLNVRGLLDSGDLPSELNRAAVASFSPIQQAEEDMRAADDAFFANAGYETTLRAAMTAGRSAGEAGQFTRTQALETQSQNFLRTQAQLRRSFDEQQAQRSSDRAIAAYQRQLQQQQAAADKARSAGTAGQIAGAVGGIVGGVAGAYVTKNPAGTTIGSNVGTQIGRSVVGG